MCVGNEPVFGIPLKETTRDGFCAGHSMSHSPRSSKSVCWPTLVLSSSGPFHQVCLIDRSAPRQLRTIPRTNKH